jgi:hydroxymethylpyrimidine pyrophosphatase-like HAD family hydrolase
MQISALACDYDGTLAKDGAVDRPTRAALERLRASGRQLVMVTGRELPDLRRAFGPFSLFDAIVAENGALFWRQGAAEALLAPGPPSALIASLKRRGVWPLSVGRSIVATWVANEGKVRSAIAELGLDWRIILNKDSLMCLPPGVDKASGLAFALDALQLSPQEVLGVGDAENDLAFLRACGVSAGVANALPSLKAEVDLVTKADHGAGVAELIDQLLAGRLGGLPARPGSTLSPP